MNPKFIYVFDSLCSWCYAFHPELMKTLNDFSDYDVRLITGGMFTGNQRKHALDLVPANKVSSMYKHVIDYGKAEISPKYINQLVIEDNYYLDSERTSTGFVVFRYEKSNPLVQLDFVHETQKQMYIDGINPNSDEYYTNVLPKFNVDSEHFFKKLKDKYYQDEAIEDWQEALQLQATSFPQLFLQTSRDQYYLISKGYSKYEELKPRIMAVIREVFE